MATTFAARGRGKCAGKTIGCDDLRTAHAALPANQRWWVCHGLGL